MDEKTINNKTTIDKPEVERLTDFLTSMFYNIRHNKFAFTGLNVNKLINDSYEIRLTLTGIEEGKNSNE